MSTTGCPPSAASTAERTWPRSSLLLLMIGLSRFEKDRDGTIECNRRRSAGTAVVATILTSDCPRRHPRNPDNSLEKRPRVYDIRVSLPSRKRKPRGRTDVYAKGHPA